MSVIAEGARESAPPPARFGRYEVLFSVARGGMAEVLAVRLTGEGSFERYFALKRMASELVKHEKFVQAFLDEARLTAAIHSPHVVQVVDIGRDERGAPFLVMELVHGSSLNTVRKSVGSLPLGMIVDVGAQAARGLHDAHEARDPRGNPMGIVHRDVSPQNILLSIDGRVRIADFGIARAKQRLAQATQSGELKGKFGYFAPEQLRGQATPRTDVFALGVVLWELIAQESLFQRTEVVDTLMNVERMPIPRLDEHVGVPGTLATVIARALERDPASRWASALDFANALAHQLESGLVRRVDPAQARDIVEHASRPFLSRLADAAGDTTFEDGDVPDTLAVPLPDEGRGGTRRLGPPPVDEGTVPGGVFPAEAAADPLDVEIAVSSPGAMPAEPVHASFGEAPTEHQRVPATRGPRDREMALAAPLALAEGERLSDVATSRLQRRPSLKRRALQVLGMVGVGALAVASGAALVVLALTFLRPPTALPPPLAPSETTTAEATEAPVPTPAEPSEVAPTGVELSTPPTVAPPDAGVAHRDRTHRVPHGAADHEEERGPAPGPTSTGSSESTGSSGGTGTEAPTGTSEGTGSTGTDTRFRPNPFGGSPP